MSSTKKPCLMRDDERVKLLAQAARHERDLFPFHQLPFSLSGAALGLRSLNSQEMKVLGLEERAAPRVYCRGQVARGAGLDPRAPAFPFEHAVENAVDDQVRVAADGRGEVRVVRRGEGEVPEVFLRIARLLERAKHEVREDALLGLSGDALGEALVVAGSDLELDAVEGLVEARVALALVAGEDAEPRAGRERDAERIAEGRGDLFELEDFLRIGLLVDAVERGR